MKVFSSWNCGKESCLACHKVLSEGFDVSYLLDIYEYGLIYLLLSIAVNQLLGLVPLSVKQLILNRDVTTVYVILFTLLSIAMLAAGIHTVKEWNSKRWDISRHSFLLLSIPCPCPICLTAIFISCTTLAAYTDLSSFAIGTSVDFVFFVTIIITSLLCMKFKKSPVNLGNVMIFIGSLALLYPVIAGLLLLLVSSFAEIGAFFSEYTSRNRDLNKLRIGCGEGKEFLARGEIEKASETVMSSGSSYLLSKFINDLSEFIGKSNFKIETEKLLQEYEITVWERTEKERMLIRVGPMLGIGYV